MSDTPYDVVLYQGDRATFEAVGSGGGSISLLGNYSAEILYNADNTGPG